MTAPERPGPERPGPDYPPEWDLEDQAAELWAHDDDHDLRHQWWHPTCDDCIDRANRLEQIYQERQR